MSASSIFYFEHQTRCEIRWVRLLIPRVSSDSTFQRFLCLQIPFACEFNHFAPFGLRLNKKPRCVGILNGTERHLDVFILFFSPDRQGATARALWPLGRVGPLCTED